MHLEIGKIQKFTNNKNLKMINKKLYRGKGYIGGVCQGLGEWVGIPSILWRVLFLFIIPAAFWVYVVLWIVLSKEEIINES
jgi:phage shock protein PspC (stress-responsive transcriptional regulator)|tara:strand:- start:27 stop:269 length:243 start_codon:yes stop_codon:yes gene_type:complete